MRWARSAGILLHPTSLPGPYGIGDLGPQAYAWVDFLAEAACSLWQVLPLGPTGYGDSPYQAFSAFGGNPYLISPQAMVEEGLLSPEDLASTPNFPQGRVDYGAVIPWKTALLRKAYDRFRETPQHPLHMEWAAFRGVQAFWLEDYALFMTLKEVHSGRPWTEWEAPLRRRDPQALQEVRRQLAATVESYAFAQFLFFHQWERLHRYARSRGILLIGDVPLFVAHDSADVWAHPDYFQLDDEGQPLFVAGVPPDYFSPTGQLWGNPVYRWEVHQAEGFAWWVDRLRTALSLVDILRLDHFRGYCACWHVPGGAKTAENGAWIETPGEDLFRTLQAALGGLPFIAEDLGVITPDVVLLRQSLGLPGMKVLQFAFGGDPKNPFLPHNYTPDCVVYTGTHDNDTGRGWFENASPQEKDFFCRYLGSHGEQPSWDLIRSAWASVAALAIAPLQDFLDLGSAARMNFPGRSGQNWTWRMLPGQASPDLAHRIRELNFLYNRQNPLCRGVKAVTRARV